METVKLSYDKNARRVYTAIKSVFRHETIFTDLKYNDDLFVIEARHGAWLSPFSESIRIRVVATGSESCNAIIESSSRSVLNLLNFGANTRNVSDLSDYINNKVYKLMNEGDIRIVPPEIKMREQ